MPIGYVVVEVEYQYNDEYYYTESEGGNPVKIFLDKAEAEKHCKKLNLEAFKKTDLSGYIIEGEWCMMFDDPEKAASKYALNLDEPWNISIPPGKIEEFVDDCKLEFYKVISVEMQS